MKSPKNETQKYCEQLEEQCAAVGANGKPDDTGIATNQQHVYGLIDETCIYCGADLQEAGGRCPERPHNPTFILPSGKYGRNKPVTKQTTKHKP